MHVFHIAVKELLYALPVCNLLVQIKIRHVPVLHPLLHEEDGGRQGKQDYAGQGLGLDGVFRKDCVSADMVEKRAGKPVFVIQDAQKNARGDAVEHVEEAHLLPAKEVQGMERAEDKACHGKTYE